MVGDEEVEDGWRAAGEGVEKKKDDGVERGMRGC